MDQDIQKYYEDLLDMFQTDGWKQIMVDYGESLKSFQDNSDYDCQTNDEWQVRRGEMKQLRNLLGYESFIRSSYDGLKDDFV